MPRVPPQRKRLTCESCLAIDVRHWGRDGLLRPGNTFPCIWSRDGRPIATIEVTVTADAVLLNFEWRQRGASKWTSSSQRVPIVWTTHHHLPHHRPAAYPWFLCPEITEGGEPYGRRVAILYRSGDSPFFACRVCNGLAYAVEQAAPRHRAILRAQRARLRLRGSPSLLEPLPERPKGMHRHTYDRLLGMARHATERWAAQQLAYLQKLGVRDARKLMRMTDGEAVGTRKIILR